ncbi:hypothetical protein AOLI_G00069000 [Acnodon oligacanthus]
MLLLTTHQLRNRNKHENQHKTVTNTAPAGQRFVLKYTFNQTIHQLPLHSSPLILLCVKTQDAALSRSLASCAAAFSYFSCCTAVSGPAAVVSQCQKTLNFHKTTPDPD